jgi:hypothetical protein
VLRSVLPPFLPDLAYIKNVVVGHGVMLAKLNSARRAEFI